MKKIFTTLVAVFLLAQICHAQWTTNPTTNDAYNTNTSGRVGIGTSAPGQNLSVAGSFGLGNISVFTTSGSDNSLQISQAGPLKLMTGNVGIGTTATDLYDYGNFAGTGHSHKFITFGSNTFVGFEHTTNSAVINFAVTNTLSSPDIVSRIISLATGTGNNSESGDLAFYTKPAALSTAALERMRILSNGNVGIGTTSPSFPLTVQGSAGQGIQFTDGNISNITGTFSGAGFVGTTTNHPFVIWSDNTERIRVSANGNVAIGTTDAQGYKLAVNGNAIAESVTVKLHGSWPDYVFKPAYVLPALSAVKTYIDKYQHLPNMPSAQEVEKDGLNLGELVKVQTKKIEELTLYLIEKDQQITEQQKINQSLQQQITQLAKKVNN